MRCSGKLSEVLRDVSEVLGDVSWGGERGTWRGQ